MNRFIRPFCMDDEQQVVDLIVSIQQKEFNIPITPDDQPDLRKMFVHRHYRGSEKETTRNLLKHYFFGQSSKDFEGSTSEQHRSFWLLKKDCKAMSMLRQ